MNPLPRKVCSYGCVYCQVGPTPSPTIERRPFAPPEDVVRDVEARLRALETRGEAVDVVTVVPDGEPTLDENLGTLLEALRRFELPLAVITNASLLDRSDVRADLLRADIVSLKVDAVHERPWRRVNRPHPALRLDRVLEGVRILAAGHQGSLITETLLVDGINDDADTVEATARFLAAIGPDTAWLARPTRPPTVETVEGAGEEAMARAWDTFVRNGLRVEWLVGFEGSDFGSTGDPEADVLAASAVHPLREDQALDLARRGGADEGLLARLEAEGRLRRVAFSGHAFWVRVFPDVSRS